MRKTTFGFSILALFLCSSYGFSKASLARRTLLGEMPFHFLSTEKKESLETKKQNPLVQNLVRIISEPQDGLIHFLNLEVSEEGHILKLIRETENSDYRQEVKMEDLIKQPAVLARAADRDILILKCLSCNASTGGSVQLDYLYNGMTMSYRNLKMKLLKEENSKEWKLYPARKGHSIHSLRLIPRTVFGQLVGIKEILINE